MLYLNRKPKKVIVVNEKFLSSLAEQCHQAEVEYKIMSVAKDGKLNFDDISTQVYHLRKSIKETGRNIKQNKEFIKEEEKDLVHEKNYLEYAKKDLKKLLRKLEKNEEK